jgi:colanic acid/amylovoran biosynthesis glycosyltransferase
MVGVFPALTESFVRREIGALRRRGIEIVVCAVRRPGAQTHAGVIPPADVASLYARPDGVLRHLLANLSFMVRRPGRYFASLRVFVRAAFVLAPREAVQLLYHFVAGVGFCRDLRQRGVTHLHCHFTSGANMALAAHLAGDLPFSFTAHASADLFVRPVLIDEKLRRARFAVAVCEYSRRYLDSITKFRYSDKLHRVYNGVEVPEERGGEPEDATNHSRAEEARRIVSVGSLVEAKGFATLIQVCARVRARGWRLRCRIVGEGPERPTLERLIEEHRLRDSVELVGAQPLDRVYEELRQADVFVLLSEVGRSGYRDGFPTAILEAMAAELPVLATSLSGIPEMVEDGVTGLLVQERDVEASSRALQCLLESAETRRAMGRAGRSRVRELFDLDRSADQLAALLAQP